MNRKFVMFVKPTRIKLVVTIIIVFIASFFFCGIYGTAIPEACIVWISPLLFPMVLWYGFPEVIVEWEMPEYVLNVLTPFPPTFPNGWFSSWNPRRKLYLFLFQGAPEFFTLLFFTNLPYWYLIACILYPVLSRFLTLLESKLKPEAPVARSLPITFASILHLFGGILMLLYIVATEPTAIIPDLFRIYKTVDKICYLLFVLVFSILFVANFTAAIFLWRCLKYGDKITVLVFISAVYILLPWAYPMIIARISAAVSIIPFILVVKRPKCQEYAK